MRVPGVTALVGGVAGGAVQVLQAGVQGVATAADALQTLTAPVLDTVSQSTARVLGDRSFDQRQRDSASATVRWQSGRRVHLDLDPLLPFPRWHEHAAVVEGPVRAIAGVASAHVEGALGRLVVELDDDADADVVLETVRDVVNSAASDLVAAGREPQIRIAPFADPGNPLAVLVPLTAAAFDAVAIGAAVTGWVVRLPAAPKTTRAAAALLKDQPRVVAVLESRLGRVGTDLALAASTAAANGLTQAVGTPMLNLVERVLQISEAEAHRRRWRDREPQLASPNRPQAPVVPVISSAGVAKAQAPQHNWAAAAAGEASHVVVDGSIDAAIDTAKGSMAGPVEEYVDSAANGSLIAAASALVAGGGPEDAAGAVLAGIPKAAHMGRQSFAAVLGRGLADDGQMILDPGALRRLDRVKVVVIDGAALRGDHRAVLHARGDVPAGTTTGSTRSPTRCCTRRSRRSPTPTNCRPTPRACAGCAPRDRRPPRPRVSNTPTSSSTAKRSATSKSAGRSTRSRFRCCRSPTAPAPGSCCVTWPAPRTWPPASPPAIRAARRCSSWSATCGPTAGRCC